MEEAYILHTRPFKDSSLIVECFSKDHGLVSLIMRGAKRPRSRLAMYSQPFVLIQVAWRGRGDLKTLIQVDSQKNYSVLTGKKILLGLYLNELVIRLLQHHDPHPQLFEQYDATLNALAGTKTNFTQQCLLRHFELALLRELGYGIDLTQDAKKLRQIEPELLYSYDAQLGVYELSDETQSPLIISGASIIALQQRNFTSSNELREAKQLMRFVLKPYLGNRPLESRKLFSSSFKEQCETNE